MNKILLLAVALSSLLVAESELEICAKCHPIIAGEFQDSMHKHSTFYDNDVHKAVWDKHPLKAKGDYNCADCHAPKAKSKEEYKQGITCTTCHAIKDIEEHKAKNKNVYSEEYAY